jgi:hypothetical protein
VKVHAFDSVGSHREFFLQKCFKFGIRNRLEWFKVIQVGKWIDSQQVWWSTNLDIESCERLQEKRKNKRQRPVRGNEENPRMPFDVSMYHSMSRLNLDHEIEAPDDRDSKTCHPLRENLNDQKGSSKTLPNPNFVGKDLKIQDSQREGRESWRFCLSREGC